LRYKLPQGGGSQPPKKKDGGEDTKKANGPSKSSNIFNLRTNLGKNCKIRVNGSEGGPKGGESRGEREKETRSSSL